MTSDPDDALDIAAGRKPRPLTASEAAVEIAVARAFAREPAPQARDARERVRLAQEAARDLAPWRAVVRWDLYDTLAGAEQALAELEASRRGVALETARGVVSNLLREAWTKCSGSPAERYQATVTELERQTSRLRAQAPILPTPGVATFEAGRRVDVAEVVRHIPATSAPVTKADADAAIARLFGRASGSRPNAMGESQQPTDAAAQR